MILVIFVSVGVFLLLLAGTTAFLLHEDKLPRRAATLKRLAARWGGEARSGYLSSEHGLRFSVDGVPAALTFDDDGRSIQTRLQFDARSRRRLSVAPRGLLTRLLGGGDQGVGDVGFDDSFQVAASDPAWARETLDADLRRRLVSLRETGFTFGRGNLFLDVGPAGIALRAQDSLLDEPQILERFIDAGVASLRRIRGSQSAPELDVSDLVTAGRGGCPVCGHSVSKARACPACRAPHHEECWEYMGGCAIFGCGGRLRGAA